MSLESFHVIRLIQQQSQSLGDAIALEGFGVAAPWNQVSWSQFGVITSKIAQVLIQFGIEPQERAVILSHNSPQWTCADLGLLKAKAVVVPIYPTSTLAQAAYIVNDAQAKLIFAGDAEQYAMACELTSQCDTLTHVVVFDSNVPLQDNAAHYHLDSLLKQAQDDAANAELQKRLADTSLDDLLTLIYTSGTTGDPKGVMLDHRNIASTVHQHDQKMNFETGDTSLAFLPLSHVFERGWSFYVLCRGGHNVYLKDPMTVKEAITIVRPHTLCVVPRFLEKIYSAVNDKVSKASSKRKNYLLGQCQWANANLKSTKTAPKAHYAYDYSGP